MSRLSQRWGRSVVTLVALGFALLAGNFCNRTAHPPVKHDVPLDANEKGTPPRKVRASGARAQPALIAAGPRRPREPQPASPTIPMKAAPVPSLGSEVPEQVMKGAFEYKEPPQAQSSRSRGGCSLSDGPLPIPEPSPKPSAPPVGGTPLYWNAFSQISAEAQSAGVVASPVAAMQVGIEHTVSIDLSAIDYGAFFPGAPLGSAAVATEVIQMFETPKTRLNFEIAIFPDPLLYARPPGSPWSASLPVETAKLQQYVAPATPPATFSAAASLPFLFGRVAFRLKPKSVAPAAPIAVAVWVEGVPVDSFVIEPCITADGRGGSCPQSSMTVRRAANAAATASLGKDAPDAALQILSLGKARMGGVFRRRGETLDAAAKWYLPGPEAQRQKLSATLTSMGTAALANLPGLGETLVKILFPRDETGAVEAEKRFRSFAVEAIKAAKAKRPRKRFVARMPLTTLVPLGLAAVRLSPKEPAELLGNHLEIELPLEQPWTERHADPATACNVRWLSVLPPSSAADAAEKIRDGTMIAARARLERFATSPLVKLWMEERPDETFHSFGKFSDWIGNEDESLSAAERRSALVVLSHHDQNRLFFDDDDALPYTAISRRFVAPSFAILDACGTGNPAAAQIVDSLNAAGFAAFVATAMEVDKGMAVDFLGAFAEALTETPGPVRTGKVYARALEILMQTVDDSQEGVKRVHGLRAHSFMLLGDPDVPLCNPHSPEGGSPP